MPMPGKAVRSSPRPPPTISQQPAGAPRATLPAPDPSPLPGREIDPTELGFPSLLDIANRKEQTRGIASQMAKL